MADRKWEMTPYVNVWGSTPDEGIPGFNDSPRYGSGFGAVHHCISFVPETHMLKPYPDRLKATYAFMEITNEINKRHEKIINTRKKAIENYLTENKITIDWKINKDKSDMILFKGYEAIYKPSEVTGLDRLFYDRNKPYAKEIPYWNYFSPKIEIEKPYAYIIPQAYSEIIERLTWNNVEIKQLTSDLLTEMEMYYIKKYEDRKSIRGTLFTS
ncbi:MAG: hypothetical protein R2825_04440 [Saprospiraceae bacterium]